MSPTSDDPEHTFLVFCRSVDHIVKHTTDLYYSLSTHCYFLPRDAMHKRGLCRHGVFVCLSVCVFVTFVSCVKTNKDIFDIFFTIGYSQAILVFPCQTGWRYSDGNPPNGGVVG